MAWGLFPLFFAAAHMDLGQIGTLAAIYPATWGVAQIFTGALVGSRRPQVVDRGRHVGAGDRHRDHRARGGFAGFALGCALLGRRHGDGLSDAARGDRRRRPSLWRASAVGVYRLWRDLGYAVGAVLAGLTADALGLAAAMWLVAALTLLSGLQVALRMQETHRR
jgi:MFS family permease